MYIDIILVVFVLILAIIGYKKGLIESILSLFGTVVSLTISIVVCKPVAKLLESSFKLTSEISKYVYDHLVKTGGALFSTPLSEARSASSIIEHSELSSVVKLLTKAIMGDKAYGSGAVPGTDISNVIAGLLVLVLSVIVTFILIRIAVWLITKIFDRIFKNRAISGINKILGFIFGTAKALLFIAILFVGVTVTLNTSFGATVEKHINDTTVTKLLFEPVKELTISTIGDIDFNEIVGGLIGAEK